MRNKPKWIILNKQNKILWILIIVVFALFALELQKGIFYYANTIGNAVRINIFDIKNYITKTIDKYTNQANEISRLKEIEKEKEKNDILISNLKYELDKIKTLLDINQKPNISNIFLVEAYSYMNMGKYSQVWLKNNSFEDKSQDMIFGLIKNGFTAGIALFKGDYLIGILNGDPKASYGVYIGENKSIGILKTDISGDIVVEYINAWNEIKEGDEIYTNGLDGIFFEGIPVGKVKKVRQEYGYIVVDVELYNKNNNVGYFWLVDTNINKPKM
ncbi:rod shape-determining protein MreC [Helicobacter sp. MIT 14-3879]|uniref:rod shape-determining protein MreC n=1 Tax=Helicobacter sp. MIT 14-3879 TaxID=2040649 RepID=UPI000E1F2A7C|nr:rod shape-determining protein MreC [Helicobacter sp. MIT 14-3879]RDU65050.1 rod shape-determining protein MreC [Helicobacter sp. MIT 14-3879]